MKGRRAGAHTGRWDVSVPAAGGAKRLCASARAGETDDRAVVMIWRD